jgi:hypothetical protein
VRECFSVGDSERGIGLLALGEAARGKSINTTLVLVVSLVIANLWCPGPA